MEAISEAPQQTDIVSEKFVPLMDSLGEKNKQAIEAGKNRLGYWIGPNTNDVSGLKPVFILSQPVDKQEPYSWQTDEGQKDAFKLVRRYVAISPDGPLAIRFTKRLVNQDGTTSEYHVGPGGVKTSDNDDVEGGENGTFLRVLSNREGKVAYTSAGPVNLGLGETRNGSVKALFLGHGQMEEAVYTESDPNTSFWGLDSKVDDDVLEKAIELSLENSNLTPEPTADAQEQARLVNQASILGKYL